MEKMTRTFDCDLRSEKTEKGATIIGRPIVYEAETDLGYFREIISEGALDEADLRDVRLLINHNFDMVPLARSRRNTPNSTMRLMPNNKGLDFEADIDIERNEDARKLNSAIERKDITGMSFAFDIDKETWDDLDTDKPLRRIEKIGRVYEVSAVMFPAYEQTEISTRDCEALENARKALENARSADTEARSKELELEKAKMKNRLIGGTK